MEIKRSIPEYISWFDQKYSILLRTKNGQSSLRLKKSRPFKAFIEEALPLRDFLEKETIPDQAQISHKLGNQNYDVLIEHDNRQNFLEITQCIADEDFAKAMAALDETGTACGEAKWHEDALINSTRKILLCIKNKLEKKYPDNTDLLVYVNDMYPFTEQKEKESLLTTIKTKLKMDFQFRRIYILGTSREIFEKYSPQNHRKVKE